MFGQYREPSYADDYDDQWDDAPSAMTFAQKQQAAVVIGDAEAGGDAFRCQLSDHETRIHLRMNYCFFMGTRYHACTAIRII